MKRRMKRHAVIQPLNQSYRFIALTKGQNAVVDAADFEWLDQWNWIACFNACSNRFYAERRFRNAKSGAKVKMHQMILGSIAGEECDHIDGDTLNNRRSNLRKCTHTQNTRNRGKPKNNMSGYKGVSFRKDIKKWGAYIGYNPKKHLGFFTSAKQAASAYDEAAKRYHGEFARLNFQQK